MIEIISRWILNRLGWVVDMTPETFRTKTKNGRLLAQMLLSYDVITIEELNLLKKSNHVSDCYDNFNLINDWMRRLHLDSHDEDIYEIVNGVGSASLDLFYRVFLELRNKTKLDFLTDHEINAQLGKWSHRFEVNVVNEDLEKLDLQRDEVCELFLERGDVYRWYKDRLEALQMRCKEARDEYLHNAKFQAKSSAAIIHEKGALEAFQTSSSTSSMSNEDVEAFDSDKTYEELIQLQEEARSMQKFVPNPKKAEKILNNVRAKRKVCQEKKQLGTQWHQAIMSQFDKKISDSKAKCDDRLIVDTFMRQSLYEKEIVSKLGQVKLEIEHIKENRFKQCELLNKLKENNSIDALILKEKELNEHKLMYFLERERLLELNQRIGNEKASRNQSSNKQLCNEALKDIMNISIKISKYKKRYAQEPDRRAMENLKNLFVTGEPIFEICEPIIDIIKDNEYDIPERIISGEISRQNAMDQQEFEKYQKYEWPWEVRHSNTELIDQIRSGLDVFGYIVHRSLERKYPRLPLFEKPYFPQISTRVCLNGLIDASILPNLRKLLRKKHIKVIELNDAVDYCLAVYKQETKRKEEEEEEDDVPLIKEPIKEVARLKKGQKSSSQQPVEEEIISEPTEPQTKKVQTPQKYPCEAIPYTHSAQLGKAAQDLLEQGKSIGDVLLIDMFIEYLRSISNLKGWVLVNYPTNLDQALLIEEALTGVNLGPTTFDDIDTKRHSKLLSNPIVPKPVQVYDTALTAFVRLKKLSVDDTNCDALLPPIHEQSPVNVDSLDKFYSDAGANYSMYYKELDWGTTKYLGKLIIGDYSLPLKASSELFGETAHLHEHITRSVKATKVGRKLKKPTFDVIHSTKVIVDAKDKKGKTQIVIVFVNKSVQVPNEDDEEEYDEAEDLNSELPETEQREYCQSTCPDELLVSLATVWETVEEIYTTDLKEVFFLIRSNLDSVMPFAQYVIDCMRKIIDRPDQKSMCLSKFQNEFNAFDADFRTDDEFKVEMHCRIEDFKEKLAEMSEEKMIESEKTRCHIIKADWAPRQLNELVNNYLTVLQIEVELFIESIHFINDYYMGIMSGYPTDNDIYKEETIPKFREIGAHYINKMFLNSSSNIEIEEFEELLWNVTQKMQSIVKKISGIVTDCIEKPKGGAWMGTGKQAKSKAGSQKSKTTKGAKTPEESLLKDDVSKLKEEWQCAANGQTLRINLQIELIKNRALESIREFLTSIQKSYHEVFNAIRTKYSNEMENIDKVCNIFKAAVENEVALQKEFSFEGHLLRINPEVNLYDNAPIIPQMYQEIVEEGAFTIAQLSKLTDIFLDLSPSGYISKGNFIFVLQNAVNNEDSLLPKLWKKLVEETLLKKVADSLFDELEYVYWKDFIVNNIRIPFPSEMEICNTKEAFSECDPDTTELIQNYQLYSTNLWFENIQHPHRNIDIKKLLYKLYRIENYGCNYTAMLLDFCKAQNAVEGFVKALQLFLGKMVCRDTDMGNIFKEKYLESKHQQEVNGNTTESDLYETIHQEINKLVDVVVDTKLKSEASLVRESCLKRPSEKVLEVRGNKSVEFKMIDLKQEESSSKSSGTDDEEVELVNLYEESPDNNAKTASVQSAEIIFVLPLDVIVTVLEASIPWHERLQNIGDLSFCEKATEIYEKCRKPDLDMSVLAHEFLDSEMFRDLLNLTKKFCALDPVEIVQDVLEENV
ncbi:unnamed protein product [Ceutorhynchus assimilis]|uniref:Sperm flagellar protein 2 n=1 Tax=Ceutorhynchus assimilis TaxID=467358 RepID=A0A9N9MB66_9CUCU|nr:unnamed protein product [Ceutorhynchus assimilis]